MSSPRLRCAAALLLLAACGPMRRNSDPPALVIFENQSTEQADVFAVRTAGDRLRIGTVFPGRTDTLRVRPSAIGADGNVRIVARILASSRTPSSGPVTLRSGDGIVVTLPPQANILNVLPFRP